MGRIVKVVTVVMTMGQIVMIVSQIVVAIEATGRAVGGADGSGVVEVGAAEAVGVGRSADGRGSGQRGPVAGGMAGGIGVVGGSAMAGEIGMVGGIGAQARGLSHEAGIVVADGTMVVAAVATRDISDASA